MNLKNPEAVSLQNPFWAGMLSAWTAGCMCVFACVPLLPGLIKATEWMHTGLRPDDRLGFLGKLRGTLVILNEVVLATEVMASLPKANEHLLSGNLWLC